MLVKTTSKAKSHLVGGFLASSNWKVNHVQFSFPTLAIVDD